MRYSVVHIYYTIVRLNINRELIKLKKKLNILYRIFIISFFFKIFYFKIL